MRGIDLLCRRRFLQMSGSGVTLLAAGINPLSPTPSPSFAQLNSDAFLRDFGPIDRTLAEVTPRQFFGDANTRPHGALWNLEGFLKDRKIEGAQEVVPLVIIGGGAAGLFSAYQFREYQPIVLEQAPRLGGNAKGHSWRGIDYAIGSAYIDSPIPGQPMARLFSELKLDEVLLQRATHDPVQHNGKSYTGFWDGESDPANAKAYLALGKVLASVAAESQRPFPFIPALTKEHMQSVKHYDQSSLYDFARKACGGKIPAPLETALEYYCWSTYAGSTRELSAAGVINFLAQEVRPIWVGAGGNAKIIERLISVLLQSVPSSHLRPSCLAVDVSTDAKGVTVTYEDAGGKLRQIRAKAAIMACPKFVAARILKGIEPPRLAAIQSLKYRAYMTANLLINRKMPRGPYDIFMIGKGKADFANVCQAQAATNATDFVLANFAQLNAEHNVLTFYRAFPCDGMRGELNAPTAYADYRKRFEEQIERDILPMLNLAPKDVVDLRLTLWGHALPLCATGIFRNGTIDTLRRPFQERVFFIEQDNWAYPSLQTGATDVALMRDDILGRLTA